MQQCTWRSIESDHSKDTRLCTGKRLTVNTLMQGVWAWLLHRYTGNNEVVYGVVVSGRPDELPGVERRVGMYINTLALKAEFGGEQQTESWLQSFRQNRYPHGSTSIPPCRKYRNGRG